MTVRLVASDASPVWRASAGSADDDRVTECLAGEPVLTTGVEQDGRAEVVVPWQPSSLDGDGYPGWISVDDLGAIAGETPALEVPDGTFPAGIDDPVDLVTAVDGDVLSIGFCVGDSARAVARVAVGRPPAPR